jgi:ATP adenylyltransferase
VGGWRSAYLDTIEPDTIEPHASEPDASDPAESDSGPAAVGAGAGRSLFESILGSGLPDEETFIIWRGPRCFALLNLYPYSSGHVLVLPWSRSRRRTTPTASTWVPTSAVPPVPACPTTCTSTCCPRWSGDTNFTTTIAELRVVPEPLPVTWAKITKAWPR